MSAAPIEQHWNYERAAAFLGLTKKHLQLLTSRKLVPHYRLGARTVTFNPQELREWLEARKVTP